MKPCVAAARLLPSALLLLSLILTVISILNDQLIKWQ